MIFSACRHLDGVLASTAEPHVSKVSDLAYQVLSVIQHLQAGFPDAIMLGEVVHTVQCCATPLPVKAPWMLI